MKKMYSILAAVLFVAALALLTGAEVNPIQAVYALPMMCAAAWIFRAIDREASSENRKEKSKKPAIRYQEAA